MAVLRTIKCDVKDCENQYTEPSEGEGWKGWGALQGIALDGVPNPALCPDCLEKVANFIDGGLKDGLD